VKIKIFGSAPASALPWGQHGENEGSRPLAGTERRTRQTAKFPSMI
jgi:hypothetical protein